MAKRGYHHGDLRRALLEAAAAAIEESGPAALSLRELARRAGVSHAAPTHHFGDKAGLLTALAAEGYDELATELAAARDETGGFLEVGVAYVRFAATHRAHFEVMFRPDLYHPDDPDLAAAQARSDRALYTGVTELPDGTLFDRDAAAESADGTGAVPPEVRQAGLAAWSLAHGFATLWLNGALRDVGDSTEIAADAASSAADAARIVLRQLNPDAAPL